MFLIQTDDFLTKIKNHHLYIYLYSVIINYFYFNLKKLFFLKFLRLNIKFNYLLSH